MTTGGPTGTLEVALAHAGQLLASDPLLAAEQAREILAVVPQQPQALLLLGLAEGAAGNGDAAVAALRRAVALDPRLPDAWRALADHLTALGDTAGADAAYAQHLKSATRDPRLLEAAVALCEDRIAPAEALLRAHLWQHPTDIAAIRMLAEVASRLGRYGDAQKLLERCLELAPGFTAARHNLAVVLNRQGKAEAALAEVDRALADEPRNPGYRNLKAAILGRIGEYARSIEIYAEVLTQYPGQAKAWMSYGHALKAAGQQDEGIAAYRRSLELAPTCGETWWSLANLKTFRFTDQELAQFRSWLEGTDLSVEDRFHFHFAIGKALEDRGDYTDSFRHYALGNRLRRETVHYDPDELTSLAERSKALFSKQLFEERRGFGHPAPDPIFIVGLPRSGSTLLEQILASHPLVEGTMELPDVLGIARELGAKKTRSQASKYPEILATLGATDLRSLGERYLAQTRIQRKTAAPFFIDKMPNNFAHVGLIHLMLPNARIIDARRHPLACCFSCFKQHFARGQHFSYDLGELGRYYRDYVGLMAHFDAVLPGRVHRVFYEQLVADTEAEVRRLLDYCGLPWDAACLRFWENERAVRTASSEQVRQPIYRDGVDQWRRFEPWLGPLAEALGPVLEAWPDPPPP